MCKVLDLEKDDVLRKNKKKRLPELCDARHIIIYLIRHYNGKDYSYRSIAKSMGLILKSGKGDHAAAMYSELTARLLLRDGDKAFTAKFEKVKCEISKKLPLEGQKAA